MAPDAKVAFVDLADSSGSGIKIPQDLSQRYFPLTYGVGSRVHSDSWGSVSQELRLHGLPSGPLHMGEPGTHTASGPDKGSH